MEKNFRLFCKIYVKMLYNAKVMKYNVPVNALVG